MWNEEAGDPTWKICREKAQKVGEGRASAEAVQEAQKSAASVRAIKTPELSRRKTASASE